MPIGISAYMSYLTACTFTVLAGSIFHPNWQGFNVFYFIYFKKQG